MEHNKKFWADVNETGIIRINDCGCHPEPWETPESTPTDIAEMAESDDKFWASVDETAIVSINDCGCHPGPCSAGAPRSSEKMRVGVEDGFYFTRGLHGHRK